MLVFGLTTFDNNVKPLDMPREPQQKRQDDSESREIFVLFFKYLGRMEPEQTKKNGRLCNIWCSAFSDHKLPDLF